MPQTDIDPYFIVGSLQVGATYVVKQTPFLTPFGEQLDRGESELVFLGLSSRGFGLFDEGKPAFIRVHNIQKNLTHLVFIKNICAAALVCPQPIA